MDRTSQRTGAVATAAAHDFNNELTVILSSIDCALTSLEKDHEARPLLYEIRASAQRCVFKTSALLHFGARVHPAPVRASFEYLIEQ